MIALIRKECRLQSWLLVIGAAAWLGPYLFGALWLGILAEREMGVSSRHRWTSMLQTTLTISLMASALLLLLLGANSFRHKRADRSAESPTSPPQSRVHIIASKAFPSVAFAVAVWATGLLIVFAMMPALGDEPGEKFVTFIGGMSALYFLLFGSAWLGSSIFGKPLLAASFGLGLFLLVGLGFDLLDRAMSGPATSDHWAFKGWRECLMTLIGISCFGLGCWRYSERGES